MTFCPNCSADLSSSKSTERCWNCEAFFGRGAAWRPTVKPEGVFVPTHPPQTSSESTPQASSASRFIGILFAVPLAIAGVLLLLLSSRLQVASLPAVGLLLLALCVATTRSKVWASIFLLVGYALIFLSWNVLLLLTGVGR
jgi:hypothetical protein